ncbi:TIGR02301 family protein [Devosia sp. Leaf64]|uniref:TIGR02301 family protein n=1 Tax=Devosia sp. Leaf64 TaxID=1736229 RepID=UPI0009EA2332|nr:TIGR02301 family protein [Devosia sp. Leaf64]
MIRQVAQRMRRHPLPTSPIKGEVPIQFWAAFRPTHQSDRIRHSEFGDTSPLMGEEGGGGAASTIFKKILPLLLALTLTTPTLAVDPPYQRQMERLAEVMGSLYYLQPLCEAGSEDWRAQMSELISLDEPDEDRRQRLAGAFNSGYTGFSRLHRHCTPASREALSRLMVEAQQLARSIHTRFAE